MPKPLKLACYCGFSAEAPQAFVDHCQATGHIQFPVDAESGDLAELYGMLRAIQAFDPRTGDPATLPEGLEIRPISEADLLADADLTEEQKQEIRDRLRNIHQADHGND